MKTKEVNIMGTNCTIQFSGFTVFGMIITTRKRLENACVNMDLEIRRIDD